MADAQTRALCTEIIHSHFGPLTAKVASVLLTKGRSPFAQVVRLSSLKPRTVRSSILVLVQHNLLWHSKGDDGREVFEINTDECIMRMRFGYFIWLSEQLYGSMASQIISLILDHGKLRSTDIISRLSTADTKHNAQLNQMLVKLVSHAYLKPSTVLSHLSPRDKCIQYEAEEKKKISGFPTPKELRESKEIALARLKREEEEAEQAGLKRKAKDQPGPKTNKRKTETEELTINDTVYFRLNYDRFLVHMRNKIIEGAVKSRFNQSAASVMKIVLNAAESNQSNISEPRSAPLSIASVLTKIPEGLNLSQELVYPSKKVSNSTCVKDYLGMLACADNPTPEGRSAAFLSYSSAKVQVEFEAIVRKLRRTILESFTHDKHGSEGLRIYRLLLDNGKMDEKQISKIVMMAAKDVRPLLVALSNDGLVSTQEVPKSADRNPARTFYLWYSDQQKASACLLANVYKTLHNIIARRRSERSYPEVVAVLEKRERSDVSQDESLLTRLERNILDEWRVKEGKLTTLEMRVEELVFLLKDLKHLCPDD